jgi:hypothetical protein
MHGPVHRWNAWLVCGVACAVVAVVCVAAVSRIRTFSHAADVVCVLAAIAAYIVAIAAVWRIRPRVAGVAAAAVVVAPLVAFTACLAPLRFGWLTFELSVLEMTSPPEQTEAVSPTVSCRVYGWGAAFGDEGYTVYVYRHPPFFPLVQREVAQVTTNQSDFNARPRSASCASVAAQLRS